MNNTIFGRNLLVILSFVGFYFFVNLTQDSNSKQAGSEERKDKFEVNTSQIDLLKDMNTFRAVFVTVPNIEIAKKIAHGLVSNKLAACVNIIPQVTSVYEWEGKVNEDSELILMIKSQEHLFEELQKFVKDNHPYDVPEVIGLPIQEGSKQYLDWIVQNTKKQN